VTIPSDRATSQSPRGKLLLAQRNTARPRAASRPPRGMCAPSCSSCRPEWATFVSPVARRVPARANSPSPRDACPSARRTSGGFVPSFRRDRASLPSAAATARSSRTSRGSYERSGPRTEATPARLRASLVPDLAASDLLEDSGDTHDVRASTRFACARASDERSNEAKPRSRSRAARHQRRGARSLSRSGGSHENSVGLLVALRTMLPPIRTRASLDGRDEPGYAQAVAAIDGLASFHCET